MMTRDREWQLIDRVYEAGATGDGWGELVGDVADFAGAHNAWMVVAAPSLRLSSVVAPRSDPDVIGAYERHWHAKDPTVASTLHSPVGRITSLADTGDDAFLRSEFYNDFWKFSGHARNRLAANLILENDAFAAFGLQPPPHNEEIDPELARRFRWLLPHLVRSVELRCAHRRLELERELFASTPLSAVVLVDAEGRIILSDRVSDSFMEDHPEIQVSRNRFGLRDAAKSGAVLRQIEQCCRRSSGVAPEDGKTMLEVGDGSVRIEVQAMPVATSSFGPETARYPRRMAKLVLFDTTKPLGLTEKRLQEAFGFTPAEARLALQLVSGRTRASVAESLGVSSATVRTHMMHIFQKAGVHTRAALVKEMAEIGFGSRGDN